MRARFCIKSLGFFDIHPDNEPALPDRPARQAALLKYMPTMGSGLGAGCSRRVLRGESMEHRPGESGGEAAA